MKYSKDNRLMRLTCHFCRILHRNRMRQRQAMHHCAQQQETTNPFAASRLGRNLYLVLALAALEEPLRLVDSPPMFHQEIHININSLSLHINHMHFSFIIKSHIFCLIILNLQNWTPDLRNFSLDLLKLVKAFNILEF